MRRTATFAIWSVSSAVIGVAGVIAILFVLMATSMDPTEMVAAGIEPWTDATYAAVGFVVLCLVTAIALRLWHSRRFWILGLALTSLDVCGVAWITVWIIREYF